MKTQFLFIYKNIYVYVCVYILTPPPAPAHITFILLPLPPLFKTKAPKAQRLLPLEDWAGAAPIAYVSRLREGAGE